MAQRTVIRLRAVIGAMVLLAATGLAAAQEQVGPEDLTRSTADPVEKLVGLWRVDRIDARLSSDALTGRTLRIDRQSVATLTLGTCTNPSFVEQLGSITVACLGRDLATVAWNPQEPGMIDWSERDLRFVLRRISGTEALDSPPAMEGEEDTGDSQ